MAIHSVTIVIPNWNGRRLLEKHLPSVFGAKGYKKNNIKEIIVVDDFSKDGSQMFLQGLHEQKRIKLIKHTENRGFSASVNTGVRMARSSLVCLLNTDVDVSENFLESTLKLFEDKKLFGVSLNEQEFGPSKGKFENGYIAHEGLPPQNEVSSTFWISGGSGVFKRSIWKELKGMDEQIFTPFYWEDVDLSYRALKRGYKLLWDPTALVDHQHESVININNFKKRQLMLIKERNILLFNWKNLTSKKLFAKHKRAMLKRAITHPGYFIVIYMALKKYKYIKNIRKKEVKTSKVSDEAIFASFENI